MIRGGSDNIRNFLRLDEGLTVYILRVRIVAELIVYVQKRFDYAKRRESLSLDLKGQMVAVGG